MVSHNILGAPGRRKRLREPENGTQRTIFIIIFFIDGFIVHDVREKGAT